MPVLAAKAASISSSAFFIEAAAKTVRVLSAALAGEKAAPHRIEKAAKIPAIRYIGALHTCSRSRDIPRTQIRRRSIGDLREAEAPFRPIPNSLRPLGISREN